jgi:hypothetical protein
MMAIVFVPWRLSVLQLEGERERIRPPVVVLPQALSSDREAVVACS